MRTSVGLVAALLCRAQTASAAAVASNPTLPQVDLGYVIQQATLFNSTGDYYNFSNVRYAAPPVGNLRFRAPQQPAVPTTKLVDNGTVGRICPQANPAWELTAEVFVPEYLTGQPFNATLAADSQAQGSKGIPPQDPRTTEDCLFLDVVVPSKVYWNYTQRPANSTYQGAPVLVWIHGGGFVFGSKSEYSAAGLVNSSKADGGDGVVFVSLNYRLGAFGWLSGPTLQSDGVANAGLYDQRLALQWVQQNIKMFGGDPGRVTVIGESAGGASIMHQITAFAGLTGPAPFQQAVLQSPGWDIVPSYLSQEKTFRTFLSYLNVTSVQAARNQSFDRLNLANIVQVGLNSSYGTFSFGPVVDGLFAPATPGKLLLQGSFDRNLKLMLGHNADEGLDFTNPYVTNSSDLSTYIKTSLPTIQQTQLNYVTDVLYPPTMPGVLGTTGYSDIVGRVALIIAEAFFTCNTYYLERAFNYQTYGYQFSVPPALHGQDVPYTFFNGPSSSVANDSTAQALQDYITSFAINGAPSGTGFPYFPIYGNNSQIINLNVSTIGQIMDPVANARCLYWQKELYA